MAAATPRKRTTKTTKVPEASASRLMRVPAEAYVLIQEWAERHRRHMNQQLAVMVEEWDRAERQKMSAEERRRSGSRTA